MMNSFLSSLRKDFCLFYLPSLAATLLCLFSLSYRFQLSGIGVTLFSFITIYFIDAGHNFLSGLRVFRKLNNESMFYLFLIVVIFITNLAFAFWSPLWLFRFYLYFTVFHHIRQNWGLTAWYQKLNQRFDSASWTFVHMLLFFPFLAYHFNPKSKSEVFFQNGELLLHPSQTLFLCSVVAFILTSIYFFYHEIRNFKKFGFESNRVMSIICPVLVQSFVFFCCTESSFVLLPLILGHSLTYFFLVGFSLQKLKVTRNTYHLSLLIGSVAVLGGLFLFLTDSFVDSLEPFSNRLLYQFLTATLTLPSIWHYVVDAFIWKSKDPEAAIIYKNRELLGAALVRVR